MNIIQRLFKREVEAKKQEQEQERKRIYGYVPLQVHGSFVEKSCEDSETLYLNFPDGLRIIVRGGKIVGWYVCGEKEESNETNKSK